MLKFLVALLIVAVSGTQTIIGLIEACRHGARSPIYTEPFLPGDWDIGVGELTPTGMRMHYLNGYQFR
jgi:hypothetical protein